VCSLALCELGAPVEAGAPDRGALALQLAYLLLQAGVLEPKSSRLTAGARELLSENGHDRS